MYWRSSKKTIWVLLFLLLHHCVKSYRIRSFSGSYFPTFELNTFGQSECEKIGTTKTPNTDTTYLRTGRKLNVCKTCRRLPGDLMNVQFVWYIQFTSCCRCSAQLNWASLDISFPQIVLFVLEMLFILLNMLFILHW